MIKIKCPISGAIHALEFGGAASQIDTKHLDVLHPLLLCDYDQLTKVSYPHAPTDQWVLFCAYLYQINHVAGTELIRWSGQPNSSNFSTVWLTQNYLSLRQFVTTLRSRNTSTAMDYLQGIRIDSNTGSLQVQTWIESNRQLLVDNSSFMDADARSTASKLFEANLRRKKGELSSQYYNLTAGELETTVKYRRAKTQRAFIEHCLDTRLPLDKIESICKVIFRPNDYEVITLRQVKAICLDLLWEHNLESANEKTAILHKLDQTLYDKLSMLKILDSLSADDLKSHDELVREYTIDLNGTEYHNGILQNKYGTSTKQVGSLIARESTPEKIYTSEPQRSDFPNALAYTVALRIYSRQQASGAN